ncbi:MAG TPA: S8 family peptidase [Ideonella sp.]|uniref:S8 family peptidase n=1 Tax=Ideonella sp. TaxID=1929293 RepID=UPI002E2F76A1|nr:S8 family peptidase [Ideonella sp.]HEX5684437.1 S8 family peptidase [Ideonella sp.]
MRVRPAARLQTRALKHHPAWPLAAGVLLLSGAVLVAPRAEAAAVGGLQRVVGEPAEPSNWAPRPQAAEELTDRLIVRYRGDSTRRSALQAAPQATMLATQRLQVAGVQVQKVHRNGQGARVLHLNRPLPTRQLEAVARQIMADDANVLYAEPDHKVRAFATATDPLYTSQWHYFEATGGLNLPSAWDVSTGSGVVVAVIDTGVRAHADLADNLLSGYDFISTSSVANDGGGRDADANDPGDGCNGARSSWHGTHVAGTIAAVTNNGEGGAGVAYGAKILPVRVLGCSGGYTSDIADAMIWASGTTVGAATAPSQPARVLNLSLGGRHSCSTTTQSAINQARANGAVVVVAAGNSNEDASRHSPANCANVVTVAATGRTGGRAYYSNYGTKIDVAAPGGDQSSGSANGVLSTLNDGYSTPGNDSYSYYQGTSMATPHVAGVAALMLARNPSLTPDEVEVLLKTTARPLPRTCAVGCGKGIVSASAAVNAVFVGASAASDGAETEPNNTRLQPQTLVSFPVKLAGTIGSGTDMDVFKINVGVGQTLTARLIGNVASNYNLEMLNGTGTVIRSSVRGAGMADVVSWTNPNGTAADRYVRVKRVSGTTGVNGTYSLELTRP